MNKKNLILGGILVVLIGSAFLYSGPVKEWRSSFGQAKNVLADLDFNQVNMISITNAGEMTVLEKVGDRWRIEGTNDFYIEDNLMNIVTNELNSAIGSEVEIVGENVENKQDFNTDEANGIKLALKQGDTILKELIIGKHTPDFQGSFISLPDIDETYSLKANLRAAFDRSDWYNKTIFESDKESINKIRFQYPTREFTVEKTEEGWAGTIPYGFEVDEEKFDAILGIMSNLAATEIPEQTFEGTGLENNLIIVQASGENTDHVLMVGEAKNAEDEEEPSLYYVKRGDSDNIYLIDKEKRDKLDNTIRSLR